MALTEKERLALLALCRATEKSGLRTEEYSWQPQIGSPMQTITYEDAMLEVWDMLAAERRERIENAAARMIEAKR